MVGSSAVRVYLQQQGRRQVLQLVFKVVRREVQRITPRWLDQVLCTRDIFVLA